MSREYWKKIPEHSQYSASSLGRIRNDLDGRIVTQTIHRKSRGGGASGYLTSWISGKHIKSHRLVAMAFLEKKDSVLNQVNHIDGDKGNNRPENLEWTTSTLNCRHTHRNIVIKKFQLSNTSRSISKRGENNPRSKLSDAQIEEIRKRYSTGLEKVKDIAKEFGVWPNYITSIGSGRYRGGTY